MDNLLKFLKFNSSLNIPTGTVVQTCKDSWALSAHNHFNPWIIDSRASEHMTNCSHLFSSYFPSSSFENFRIADGSYSSIAGKGNIKISEQITLQLFYMFLNSLVIFYLFINCLRILIILFFFVLLLVFFRTKTWGRRLELLER